jgi:hypothetical protein
MRDRAVADAKAALGEEAFAAAWARGEAMTPEEIVAFCASLARLALLSAPKAHGARRMNGGYETDGRRSPVIFCPYRGCDPRRRMNAGWLSRHGALRELPATDRFPASAEPGRRSPTESTSRLTTGIRRLQELYGAYRDRTGDLRLAKPALSQLS